DWLDPPGLDAGIERRPVARVQYQPPIRHWLMPVAFEPDLIDSGRKVRNREPAICVGISRHDPSIRPPSRRALYSCRASSAGFGNRALNRGAATSNNLALLGHIAFKADHSMARCGLLARVDRDGDVILGAIPAVRP